MTMIPMDVKNPLLMKEIRLLEEAITGGNFDKVRPYVWDAVCHHSNDKKELHRRRRFVAKNTNGAIGGVQSFALLSAFMDDMKGWETSIKFLENNIDPGFGLLVYHFLRKYGNKPELLEKWPFLVEFSRQKGHIEAIYLRWDKKFSGYGVIGKVILFTIKLSLGIKAGAIAIKNPHDPRLPTTK